MTKHLKLSVFILCTILLVTCVCLASCNKDNNTDQTHAHSYTSFVSQQPKCDAEGVTTYACECGDFYNEPIPALGHIYDTVLKQYPTAKVKGCKTYICQRSGCTHSYDEAIDTLVVSLPNVSKVFAPLLDGKKLTMKSEDSKVIFVSHCIDCKYDMQIGNCIYTVTNYNSFITVELAEAEMSSKNGVVSGYLKLTAYLAWTDKPYQPSTEYPGKPNPVEPSKYDELAELYIYVNGDDISFDYTETYEDGDVYTQEGEYTVLEIFSKAIGATFGINEDAVLGLMNICIELEDYLPLAEYLLTDSADRLFPEKLPENFDKLVDFLSDEILSETVDTKGNTVYTLNTDALVQFLEGNADLTVGEMIDRQYGAGTAKALTDFIKSLPDKKLKDIALSAITVQENYGIDVDFTYGIINYILFLLDEQEIDIGKEIEAHYDYTLSQLLAEAYGWGDDTNRLIVEFKSDLNKTTDALVGYDTDALFNLIYFGDENYKFPEADAPFSLTDRLLELYDEYKDVYELSLTGDATGIIVGAFLDIYGNTISYAFNGDGSYELTVTVENTIFEGTVTVSDTETVITGTLTDGIGETLITLTATVNGTEGSLQVKLVDETVLSASYTLDSNMVLQSITVDARGAYYDDQNTLIYFDILDLSLIKTADGYSVDAEIMDDMTFTALANDTEVTALLKSGSDDIFDLDMSSNAVAIKLYGYIYNYSSNLDEYTKILSLDLSNEADSESVSYVLVSEDGFGKLTLSAVLKDDSAEINGELIDIVEESTVASGKIDVDCGFTGETLTSMSVSGSVDFPGEYGVNGISSITLTGEITATKTDVDFDISSAYGENVSSSLDITTGGDYTVTDISFNTTLYKDEEVSYYITADTTEDGFEIIFHNNLYDGTEIDASIVLSGSSLTVNIDCPVMYMYEEYYDWDSNYYYDPYLNRYVYNYYSYSADLYAGLDLTLVFEISDVE